MLTNILPVIQKVTPVKMLNFVDTNLCIRHFSVRFRATYQ